MARHSTSSAGEPDPGTGPTSDGFAEGSPADVTPLPTAPKRRGRPPGSSTKSKPKSTAPTVDQIELIARELKGAHLLLALALQSAHWQLADEEAQILASQVAALVEEYGWDASSRALLWVNLATTLITVYAPRVQLSWQLKASRQAKKDQQVKGNGQREPSLLGPDATDRPPT